MSICLSAHTTVQASRCRGNRSDRKKKKKEKHERTIFYRPLMRTAISRKVFIKRTGEPTYIIIRLVIIPRLSSRSYTYSFLRPPPPPPSRFLELRPSSGCVMLTRSSAPLSASHAILKRNSISFRRRYDESYVSARTSGRRRRSLKKSRGVSLRARLENSLGVSRHADLIPHRAEYTHHLAVIGVLEFALSHPATSNEAKIRAPGGRGFFFFFFTPANFTPAQRANATERTS